MTKRNYLDEILDIDATAIPLLDTNTGNVMVVTAAPGVPVVRKDKPAKDVIIIADKVPESTQDDDMAFARKRMRNIINAAEDAYEQLAELAVETQSPRAYEVLANLLKTTSEAAKDLIGTHKTKAEIHRIQNNNMTNYDRQHTENVNQGTQVHVDQVVFSGTAVELLDELAAIPRPVREVPPEVIEAEVVEEIKEDGNT